MDSPEKSQQMAEKAKNFLNQEWSGLAFSRRVSMLLNDSIPEDWWIAPNQVSYLHGMGLAEDEVRSILNWMIELEGESSLCLDHHPALKQSMLSFAQGG